MLSKIKEKLLYPFSNDFLFFCLLFILLSLPMAYTKINSYLYHGTLELTYYIYLIMMFFALTYIITFTTNIFSKLSIMLKTIVSIVSVLVCLANIFCIRAYHCMLTSDYLEIIAGTNPNEAKEFFDTYVKWTDVAIIISVIGIVLILLRLSITKKVILPSWLTKTLASCLLLSTLATYRNSGMIEAELGTQTKNGHWSFQFDEIVDLRQHPTNPIFAETDTIHPQTIVLIIGESFSKSHSSLYGYQRCTNPLLSKKQESGNLIIFKDVTSPATSTTKTFKYLLTTYQVGDEEQDKKWYDCTNVLESFNLLGYHTTWISEQNETGMFDNLPSGYSKLCKEAIFDETRRPEKYDDFLIDAFSPSYNQKNFIVYHMYGQHPAFSQRYPDRFCQFGSKIENINKASKEERLADYDNATLFNDYVVNSIMDKYKDHNAIVIYLSDHALDLFESSDTHCAHANATPESQKFGKQIPLMIYQTDLFQAAFPDLCSRINTHAEKFFCTDKLIYTLLDIAGYKFANNEDVKRYSLLSDSSL